MAFDSSQSDIGPTTSDFSAKKNARPFQSLDRFFGAKIEFTSHSLLVDQEQF